ncbi:LLM class flavin-dependent oxidoreductase [Sphingobium sp. AN558]|uniref:LLM class flavin-dependent oxidoreductase n=1 Tax=Sphingobium sp. AN558 TaxID=3133442 RepID=UPI0030BF15F6
MARQQRAASFGSCSCRVGEIEYEPLYCSIGVMPMLAVLALEANRIGLLATGSTTFNDPCALARQFKALKVMSHGCASWDAVTSSGADVAANYGKQIPSSPDRYGRAHEAFQLLWGSWGKEVWGHDQASGQFAKADEIQLINLSAARA